MRIRPASPDDVPALRRLLEVEPGSWQPHWTDATVATAIASAGNLALVVEDDAAVLGFACAHDTGFRAYLSELIVSPRARRLGIATRLLDRIEAQLAARGCKVLVADVWPGAEAFYRSRGWNEPAALLLGKHL